MACAAANLSCCCLPHSPETGANGTLRALSIRGSRYIGGGSGNGVLVLVEGGANRRLTWFDCAGKKLGTLGSSGAYSIPRISRDDQRLAVGRLDPQTQNYDIHLFDLARKTEQRFTSDPGVDEFPLWSPNGSRIVWTSYRESAGNLYWKATSGAGPEEALHRSAYLKRASDWSADRRFILYYETDPQTNKLGDQR